MEQLMKVDKEYALWISELAQRYRSSQIRAAMKVNEEMLGFYWSVGEDIEKHQMENRYGSHFYENVSKDLRKALGLTRGMSETTIRYAHYFYCLYNQLIGNLQHLAEDFKAPILPQDTEEFQIIFGIPWTHHMCIIDKVKGDAKKGFFFAKKSLENNWGRALVLWEKNTVLARYALSTINRPIGISEYELARQQLPEDLKKVLPSPEEIEKELMG